MTLSERVFYFLSSSLATKQGRIYVYGGALGYSGCLGGHNVQGDAIGQLGLRPWGETMRIRHRL